MMMNNGLTGLRVLCSLKVSSRTADWSLDSLSFFRQASPPYSSSSEEVPREEDRSKVMSRSSPAPPDVPSLSLLLLLLITVLEIVLFGEETRVSSSKSTVEGKLFTSIFLRDCWFWWSAKNGNGLFRDLFVFSRNGQRLCRRRSVPEEETKVWFHGNIWRLDMGEEVGLRFSLRGWWVCANPKLRLKLKSSFPIIMINIL